MKQTAFILLHKLHRHILPPDRHRYCTYRFAIPPPIPPLIHDCAYGAFYYLGSECDHLPPAGNIYIGIHPSAHTSAYSLWAPPKAANVAVMATPFGGVVRHVLLWNTTALKKRRTGRYWGLAR